MKIQRNRFIFILLKSLKFSLNYKKNLFDNFSRLDKPSYLTYKNFFYLYIVQGDWKVKLEFLLKNYILQYFLNNFNLQFQPQLDYLEKKKDFFLFLYSYNICLIYFKFLKLIQKIFYMQRRRYLNYFFRVMLENKRKQRFLYFFNASEGMKDFLNFSKILNDLDNELNYNHIYRNLVVFLNLFYWKIQFKHTYFKGNEFSLCFKSLTSSFSLDESYKNFRKIWSIKLLDFRKFYKIFKCFLVDFINDYKLFFFFFFNFNKNLLKLDKYFMFYTLFSYLYKLNNLYKYEGETSLISLENFLNFSDFFLGKWFYQRHLNKTFDSTKFELNNFFPYIFKFNNSSFAERVTNSFKLLISKNRCVETKVLDYFILKNNKNIKLLKKSKINNFKKLLSSLIFFTSADDRIQKNNILNELDLRYKWWTKRQKRYKNSLRKVSVLKKKKFFIQLYTKNILKNIFHDIYKLKMFQNLRNFTLTNDFFFRNNYKITIPRYRFRKKSKKFFRFFKKFCKMNSMVYKDRKKKTRLKFFRFFRKQYFRKRNAKNCLSLENKAFTNSFLLLFHKRINNNNLKEFYYSWWFNT